MIFDPHIDPYHARNLHIESWRYFQDDERTIELAHVIKTMFAESAVAVVQNDYLYELGWNVAAESGMNEIVMQHLLHDHWCGIALCMLTHGSMECFFEEKVTRFYKSEAENGPLYGDNVIYKQLPNQRWPLLVPVKVIRAELIKTIAEPPVQGNLFGL